MKRLIIVLPAMKKTTPPKFHLTQGTLKIDPNYFMIPAQEFGPPPPPCPCADASPSPPPFIVN
jgi:hypothetical protein